MFFILLAVTLQVPTAGDWAVWFARGIDSARTTAHDLKSGAVVLERTSAMPLPPFENERLLQDETPILGPATVRVGVYSDPDWDVEQLRKDIGSVELDCWSQVFLEAFTPPDACEHLVRYILRTPDGRERQFEQIPCTEEQRQRGFEYVRTVALGTAPVPIDETRVGKLRRVPSARLPSLQGKTFDHVVSEFGIPVSQWPRYPDSFALIYWREAVADERVLIAFSKDRTVEVARLLCTEGKSNP